MRINYKLSDVFVDNNGIHTNRCYSKTDTRKQINELSIDDDIKKQINQILDNNEAYSNYYSDNSSDGICQNYAYSAIMPIRQL